MRPSRPHRNRSARVGSAQLGLSQVPTCPTARPSLGGPTHHMHLSKTASSLSDLHFYVLARTASTPMLNRACAPYHLHMRSPTERLTPVMPPVRCRPPNLLAHVAAPMRASAAQPIATASPVRPHRARHPCTASPGDSSSTRRPRPANAILPRLRALVTQPPPSHPCTVPTPHRGASPCACPTPRLAATRARHAVH